MSTVPVPLRSCGITKTAVSIMAVPESTVTHDDKFGLDGTVVTVFEDDMDPDNPVFAPANAVVVQPDGKIIAGGEVDPQDIGSGPGQELLEPVTLSSCGITKTVVSMMAVPASTATPLTGSATMAP